MFPTFISILDIQSWWEVPSIAHFCSLFRSAFNLLEFDIEDLEEALLTDGTEESSWLQDLIVRLLSGCLPDNEISTFNYQMFLRRLFRQKCQEHDRYNPFNTDVDFQLLPLRTKVDILHALCDFRLDASDVLERLKNLEADSLRLEPLGYDSHESAYWYFYGTRLYREDCTLKNNKQKAVWQVICFTEDDWFQLTKKFKKSLDKAESELHYTLKENFLPELPRLFKEKESLTRKRLLENLPRRTSSRLQKLEKDAQKNTFDKEATNEEKLMREHISQENGSRKQVDNRRQEANENKKQKEDSRKNEHSVGDTDKKMAVKKNKRTKGKEKDELTTKVATSTKKRDQSLDEPKIYLSKLANTGRQTNNSLSAAIGHVTKTTVNSTSKALPHKAEEIQTAMRKILCFVKNHEDAWPFMDPVEEEYAPNYYSIIREPMDLQRMEERLNSGYYKTLDKFKADFRTIVYNCKLYNGEENEYTQMVDNLLRVFENAFGKYVSPAPSLDEDVFEFPSKNKKTDEVVSEKTHKSHRKPMLVAQINRKRERSDSEESVTSLLNRSESLERDSTTKSAKHRKVDVQVETPSKISNSVKYKEDFKAKKETEELNSKKDKDEPISRKEKQDSKKNKVHNKKTEIKEKELKKKKSNSKEGSKNISTQGTKNTTKKKVSTNIEDFTILNSSSSPPSSSTDTRFEYFPEDEKKIYQEKTIQEGYRSDTNETYEDYEDIQYFDKKSKKSLSLSLSPNPKDKHNKLRETIEKLKAKSEIAMKSDLELDHLKENKDKSNKTEKDYHKYNIKEKVQQPFSKEIKEELKDQNIEDCIQSKTVKANKLILPYNSNVFNKPPTSTIEALSIATEQTLKDINKWLDSTPKSSEFSSVNNLPSYAGLDEIDVITTKIGQAVSKKTEKPLTTTIEENNQDLKRKNVAKYFKKREIQRTIDRLQPGKSKGNLITNIQNSTKTDEVCTLSSIPKLKDPKNSLIVKTSSNEPKLSLGSVLDSFGKHKFIDNQKKKEEKVLEIQSERKSRISDTQSETECLDSTKKIEDQAKENSQELCAIDDGNNAGASPNLSVWFKAFGIPKTQVVVKKPENNTDSAKEQTEEKSLSADNISKSLDLSNDNNKQPIVRQRRISSGSNISERSSFSQDMDSPKVDERGAYPAPYPSPLHRSSDTFSIMASPRSDISAKATYSTINEQIRVGFYQDTVSNKSSPDKTCSPKENSQSPYRHYSEHVYTPNTTENHYHTYHNNSYYTHVSNFSDINPSLHYNTVANCSYYDNKVSSNYTANSPDSTQPSLHLPFSSSILLNTTTSPATGVNSFSGHLQHISGIQPPGIYSTHSPIMLPQHSPYVNSQNTVDLHLQPSASIQRPLSTPMCPTSPETKAFHNPKNNEKLIQPQVPVFPVKKRTYNESEMPQSNIQKLEVGTKLSEQIAIKKHLEAQQSFAEKPKEKNYVHQNIPDVKSTIQSSVDLFSKASASQSLHKTQSEANLTLSTESNYPLDIPDLCTEQNKIDMSKYTNMGYTGPDVNGRSIHPLSISTSLASSVMRQKQMASTLSLTVPNLADNDISTKYGSNEGLELTNSLPVDSNVQTSVKSSPRTATSITGTEIIKPISTAAYDFANENKIIDLQSSSSLFVDKQKQSSYGSNSSSIFSQDSMTAIHQNHRDIANLKESETMQNDLKTCPPVPEKKSKKRKNKTVSSQSLQQTPSHQGFVSYAGLKENLSLEASTKPLKSSSVTPDSTFNFGHTTMGLGISPSLYSESDAYPKMVEEFRNAQNYYMTATASHRRPATENPERQTRPAHQNANMQTYSFLGTSHTPSSYPITGPFISNSQSQLMDTNSPFYQHYLHASVLNQGLLPSGTYPSEYHSALNMRQPYDSINRSPWL